MKKLYKIRKLIFVVILSFSSIVFGNEIDYNDYKAILVGNEKGEIIKIENGMEVRPFASITKMMTALLVLENIENGKIKLDDKVIISKKASLIPYGIKLEEGKEYTIYDLLKATIIRSSNNAAYSLGEYIGGNIENFVVMMNKKAKELELNSLRYCSPHGLPPKYTGTCMDQGNIVDIYKLSLRLVKYNEYLDISKNSKDYIKDGEIVLNSTNHLLGKVKGLDGLKTGYHNEAGSNIVLTANREGDRVFVIIFGSKKALNRDEIGKLEIENYYENKFLKIIINKDKLIGKVVINDKEYGLYSYDNIYVKKEMDKVINLKYEIELQENISLKDLDNIVGIFFAEDEETNEKYTGALILKEIK